LLAGAVEAHDAALAVADHHQGARGLDHGGGEVALALDALPALLGREPGLGQVHGVQLRLHQARQVEEGLVVLRAEGARRMVRHAERADPLAVHGQRAPRVEAQLALQMGQARLRRHVGHHQRVVLLDREVADRGFARDLGRGLARAALAPHAVRVHQRHGGHVHAEDAAGQPRDAVEALLGRRVAQLQAVQHLEAGALLFDRAEIRHASVIPPTRRGVSEDRMGAGCGITLARWQAIMRP